MKLALLCAAVALAAAVPGRLRAAVDIGQPAPDFALSDIDGRAHKLSDCRGKVVVLEWNNPECPFVHKHYDSGNIPAIQRHAMADGVIWFLINSGAPGKEGSDYTADQIRAWLQERHSTPTAYLRDPTGRVGHLYGAKATPHLFVINSRGILVYAGGIDSIRSADQGDIARADNYVKDALVAVKAGRPVARPVTQPYGCSIKYGPRPRPAGAP